MIVGHIGGAGGAGGAGAPYEIQKSLRFRASASAYLSRTPTVASNRSKWTFSVWLKRGAHSADNNILSTNYQTGDGASQGCALEFRDQALRFYSVNTSGSVDTQLTTSAMFRDPSAHYNIVVAIDTSGATNTERIRFFVNGSRITSFSAATYPALNQAFEINSTETHYIGAFNLNGALQRFFDGYLSEINFIDGQALDPSYFGEVSAETGAWVPKKYTGTYGTNGFYLPFNDGSSLANLTADRSGNVNNWTANNISLTAGVTYDWMDDTPSNNFAVLNAVHAGRSTISNANLTASGTTDLPTIIPDSGTWYFERGGSSKTWVPPAAFPSGPGDYNFGQRPWQSTGPTGGQKALCTKNLPAPSILNPKKHFDVVLATGANIKSTAEAVFPSNFLEWIKDRGNTNNHQLIDVVRGTSAVLQSNTTAAETTYTVPSGSSVAWTWKAGGAPVTNNDGSIQSQVSANPQAGFSIVTFTTPTSGNITVGHGLGKVPGLLCVKNRAGVGNWVVYHSAFSNNRDFVLLGLTNAKLTNPTPIWADQFPSSSTFGATVGMGVIAGAAHVAYCFAEIPGYSKFGSYVGNGSADGPFVYCGFRPRYVLIKRTDSTGDWRIYDAGRSPNNEVTNDLLANGAKADASLYPFDFVANGFKVRAADVRVNTGTYIFAAFAEQPFQFANAR